MRFLPILFLFTIFSCTFLGCSFQFGPDIGPDNSKKESFSKSVTLATWNTQTFFDGVTDGCEYSEFKKEKNWNNNKYIVRLERLCGVLEALNTDIVVLQEIENEAVMHDISNMMAGNSWNRKKIWTYATFVKEDKGAIGCGVFSRFPITNVKSHSLDIRTENIQQPSMRPIIEVSINVDDKILPIFVNHWKSKSGGEEITEIWRNWQEAVLTHCAAKYKNYCIATGDFNRDVSDFCLNFENGNNIILRGLHRNENIPAFSPWFSSPNNSIDEENVIDFENQQFSTEIGSYFYKNSWERIDNILAIGNIKISDFAPQAEEPWINEYGTPIKYQYFTGIGYSDHLPLKCTLNF